jgi:hypothetical protein
MEVKTGYVPRPMQAELHKKLKRFNVLNIHRRFGKSVFAVNHMLDALLRCDNKNPFGAYIAQNYSSAKRIIWQYLKDYTAGFPGVRANESELLLTIPRADRGDFVRIQLLGSERYDSLRGLYFDWVCFDEFAFSQPNAWTEVVRAALADRPGSAILISTPNGRNHFYDLYGQAERLMAKQGDDSSWFAATIRADESGVLPDRELSEVRDAIGEEAYQQEFLCSFFSQVKGAYYKDAIGRLNEKGQIKDYSIDVSVETHVAFDLGIGDSTSLWFFQLINNEVHVIDYYEDSGKGLDEYVRVVRSKPYVYGEFILPHDANARELGTGKTRVETLTKLGITRTRVLKRQTIEDGINAVRMTLPRCWFHETNTKRGLECLSSYHKEFNDKMQVYIDKPVHDWSSHASDAFRYLALGLDYLQRKKRYNGGAGLPRVSNSVYDIFGA